ARDAELDAHRLVAALDVPVHPVDHLFRVAAVRVAVDEDAVARAPAEQLVHGHAGRLALEVPERGVDGRDRGHPDGPAAPVRALVQVLPRVLDPRRVASDEQRADVILEVRRDRELAPVERRVAEAREALVCRELQRDEVPAGRADDHAGPGDRHASSSTRSSPRIGEPEPPAFLSGAPTKTPRRGADASPRRPSTMRMSFGRKYVAWPWAETMTPSLTAPSQVAVSEPTRPTRTSARYAHASSARPGAFAAHADGR